MRLTINNLDFEVRPVPSALRTSILSDPLLLAGQWREAWEWDQPMGEGKELKGMKNGRIALGNAVTFHAPRAGADGVIANNAKVAARARDRFLEATGAPDVTNILRGLSRPLPLPRISPPRDSFRALESVASFRLSFFTDFSVVELAHPGRNLSAYLSVPGQVIFQHEITEVAEQAGLDQLLKERPTLAELRPLMILPPGSRALHEIRLTALQRRIEDLRPRAESEADTKAPARIEFARLVREWQALTPKARASA